MENETIITTEENPVITPEPAAQETIAEIMNTEVKKPETVPLSAFLDTKNELKEAKKAIKDLQEAIKDGGTKKEVSASIKAIADKFDVDESFLEDFANVVRNETKAEFETKLKPFEEQNKEKQLNDIFTKHYAQAIENMPEYEKVANKEVIKALSLLPQNGDKTFEQLLEETYSNAITVRPTIESTIPSGGKEPAPLNIERAKSDTSYFNEVMNNPKLKEQYNQAMLNRGI